MCQLNFEVKSLPQSYYLRVLQIVSDGLKDGYTHKKIGENLQAANLQTPTGLAWGTTQIANLLRLLRDPIKYPSRFSNAMKGVSSD